MNIKREDNWDIPIWKEEGQSRCGIGLALPLDRKKRATLITFD